MEFLWLYPKIRPWGLPSPWLTRSGMGSNGIASFGSGYMAGEGGCGSRIASHPRHELGYGDPETMGECVGLGGVLPTGSQPCEWDPALLQPMDEFPAPPQPHGCSSTPHQLYGWDPVLPQPHGCGAQNHHSPMDEAPASPQPHGWDPSLPQSHAGIQPSPMWGGLSTTPAS